MRRLLAGILVANLLLLLPLWLQFLSFRPYWLALEAVLLVPALALAPSGWARWLRHLSVAAVMISLLLGLSNAATHHVLGRPLNVYLDIALLGTVYNLLSGVLDTPLAVVVAGLGAVLPVLAFIALNRAAAALQVVRRTAPTVTLGTAMLVGAGVALAAELWNPRTLAFARTPMVDTLSFQAEQLIETQRARDAFQRAVSEGGRATRALGQLAGRDVLLVFIESYGAGVLRREPWRDRLEPALSEMQRRLHRAGLRMASGVMRSPIRGGQSWLAHASVLSGYRVDNQFRYRLLLSSGEPTLVDDFRATGHRTMAVMPAITMAWPEGRAYGFDAIHAADDLGYAGPRLNWVTMPDQYTLHRFQQSLRRPAGRPVFAKIALISSHAPWTPVLPVLDDWTRLGDGSVFQRWTDAGEPPEELWRDLDRVRVQHARALDYTLRVVTAWAEAYLGRDDLLILMGDHPAAPMISGADAGHGVPVHVISGNASLLAPFLERGFGRGARPLLADGDVSRVPGVERLRGWLHAAFGSAGTGSPGEKRAAAASPNPGLIAPADP
ncbi:alkaline phosphatase [Ectothiorhodospiraceae bacterium WFHF3C12]|nr:alkaline phosphatase [Ectothiorhodospiraceae bacterium WFHF3C12]